MTESNRDLSNLNLPTYVKTRRDNVVDMLYRPCLVNSSKYVRGAGYFRSSVYSLMTADVLQFCIDGGKIILLTSTEWGKEDFDRLRKSYDENKLSEEFYLSELESLLLDEDLADPTRMLIALVHSGSLEIKIGVLRGSIYHEKKGYFEDDHGNVVAFDGSGNESWSGLQVNHQANSFNVSWSWNPTDWRTRGLEWKNDLDDTLKGNDFPIESINTVNPQFIQKWDIETNLDSYQQQANKRQQKLKVKWDEVYRKHRPTEVNEKIPVWYSEIIDNEEMWRDHQKVSLNEWKKKERKGVLEHATGSGKTITSLIAIKEHTDQGNNAIVLVPSQPLLEQWAEEFEEHLPGVTKALLGSGNQGEDILKEMRVSGGSVLISTMQSFRNEKVLRKVERLLKGKKSNLMLVVDECHRIGAPSYVELCKMKFPVTLGLSATPERQRDEEGTSRIFQLLGPVIHRFTLEDAMEADLLSKFEYHVKEAALTTREQKKYDELRRQIKKWFARWKNSGTEMPESLEIMIFKSRSIIRNAENKISEAVEIINSNYEKEQHWLVYCGEGMMDEIDRQITAVMGHKPLRYWSGMNRFQRKESLSQFKAKGGIMLAIKCLDEGVDIPAISHGVVLSSSKTKREWIQRRGRLLRKSPGKKQSVIYDVLAFPDAFGDETNFVMDEVKRAFEFSKSCENAAKTQADLSRIMTAYNISEEDLVSDYERPEGDEDDE